MRTRLALLAVVLAAVFPAGAQAQEPAPAPAEGEQQVSSEPAASAPAEQQAPSEPKCLPAKGAAVGDQSVRGVRVGVRARIREHDGKPLQALSVSYCVQGGGDFSFALSRESDVVLALSTADGDSIGPINPTSPAQSARAEFPKMMRITKAGSTVVYRIDRRRQLILGVAAGRVNFVAAADRLLLEYPNRLGYYMRRLGF